MFTLRISIPLAYNDGHSKMVYLDRSIKYKSFLDKVLHVTKFFASVPSPRIRSLLQNGPRCMTLVDVDADNDIHTMMEVNLLNSSKIFLYITKTHEHEVHLHLDALVQQYGLDSVFSVYKNKLLPLPILIIYVFKAAS